VDDADLADGSGFLHRVARRFFEVDGVERGSQRRFIFLFFSHGFKDYEDFSN
jgi:hypothetical protein